VAGRAIAAETWYSADEAVAAGLADEVAADPVRTRDIDEQVPVAASADHWILATYRYAGRGEAPSPVTAEAEPATGEPVFDAVGAEARPVELAEPAEPAPLTSPLLDDDAVARIAEAVAERLAQRTPAPTPEAAPAVAAPSETPATPAPQVAPVAAAPPPAARTYGRGARSPVRSSPHQGCYPKGGLVTAPTVIPTSAVELEEMLGDSSRMQALFAQPAQFGEFVTNYARAVHDKDTSLATQVREETQRVLQAFLEGEPGRRCAPERGTRQAHPVNRGQHYCRTAPGAAVDALFESAEGGKDDDVYGIAGRFLRNTWHRARGAEQADVKNRLHEIRNAFGSTVPADGGFLIPETLRSELLRVALETAVVRPRARVIPMETLTVPFPTIDSTSNASNVYGGVTAYWTEEAGALTASSASFGRVKLEAKKLTAYAEVPNELFTDSLVSLEAFIGQAFPEAIAWFEDIAFLRGSGVGEPLGVFNANAKVSVTKETGQTARRSCGRTSSRPTRACCRRAWRARCGCATSTPSRSSPPWPSPSAPAARRSG
jgi:hypothetical protein